MIVHQAERTARTIAHAQVPARPETDGGPAVTATAGPEGSVNSLPDPGSDPLAAPALPGSAAVATMSTRTDRSPDMTLCTAMGRGLSSVLDNERRQWWPPAATHPRFDHRGAEAAGRWPAPAADEPRLGRQVLPAEPGAPGMAREFTRHTLAEWRLGHLCDETLLLVSELVTNALCHGLGGVALGAQQCPVQLVLLGHRRRLVTVVTDPGDGLPVRSDRGPAAESGRGLRVVDAISAAWGWAPLATGGKAVWATLNVTPATGGPPRRSR